MRILRKYISAKNGDLKSSEDCIHISKHFIAVIDGATSKSNMTWSGKTNGQLVANIINEAFSALPSNSTAFASVAFISERVKTTFLTLGIHQAIAAGETESPSAVFCALNLKRREIWLVGDCHYRLDNDTYSPGKKIDIILSEARALYLETELRNGKKMDELLQHDTGREFILPMLKRQHSFLNNSKSGYGYPAISNSPVPEDMVHVRKIPETAKKLILATDGYPLLNASFKDSERYLENLLERDPLLFREHKSTKGLMAGNVSFDDRAWVEIEL